MLQRLTFLAITAFWVTMNVLLWRAAYGVHGHEIPVSPDLVWRKILTAPDTSSLTVYQDGKRVGFCQISTSVERAMAALAADEVPSTGLATRKGFRLRFNGNVSLGAVTNRLRFNGQLRFSAERVWRRVDLHLFTSVAAVEIRSAATNQTVHLKISSDHRIFEHDFTYAQLQNPGAWLGVLAGGFGNGWAAGLDWSFLSALQPAPARSPVALVNSIRWAAYSDRLKWGHEPVQVFRLETRVLDEPVVLYVSRVGEILRAKLPGGVTAHLDQWNGP